MQGTAFSPSRMDDFDACCDRFEAAWKARPKIVDFLSSAADDANSRSGLVRELLRLDLYYRRKSGEVPAPSDYLPELAEHATLVNEIVGTGAEGASRSGVGDGTLAYQEASSSGGEFFQWSADRFRVLASHARGGLGAAASAAIQLKLK